MLTCQQCRREIDAAARRASLSAPVETHLAACASCRIFQAERVRLQSLLGELEAVGAPPDFEFRLRARMAAQQPATFRLNWLRLTPRALGLAFAACLVCALALTLRWHAQQPPTQSAAQTKQSNIAQPGHDDRAPVLTPDQPSAVPMVAAAIKTPTHKQRRASVAHEELARIDHPAVAGDANDVNDLGLHSATTLNVTSDGNPISSQPIPVPVSTSAKPLQVMLKDTQGVARLVNIEPVSFGSRDLLGTRAPMSRIVNADSKGVW
jgi:hypothetical protein